MYSATPPLMPTGRMRRAFTLVELLVVIAIIAVLIGILLPVLSGVRDGSNRTKCMNNMRQLLLATQMYVQDSDGYLPHPNYGGTVGWLYRGTLSSTQPDGLTAERVRTGLIFPYIKSLSPYRCPLDTGPWLPVYPSNNLTSYLMNGAVCGYGNAGQTWGFARRRMADDAVCFWEPMEENNPTPNAPSWNDGGSHPGEGFTVRHGANDGDGACVGLFGGGAEWMSRKEFAKHAQDPEKNRLWCAPDTANGR